MISETAIATAIIARLKAMLPPVLSDSVLPYLDKPRELTAQNLTTRYPKGLYLVQFAESDGADNTESLIFAVCALTVGIEQNNKLCRAAKLIMPGFQVPGTTRFKFHGDKQMDFKEDNGIIGRMTLFVTEMPATPKADAAIASGIGELNI